MGAHVAPLVRVPTPKAPLLLALLVVISSCVITSSGKGGGGGGVSESETLLKFKQSLKNADQLAWDTSKTPCTEKYDNWRGVLCLNGHVIGLQLENMGLTGVIDVDALVPLRFLRTLSFMNNNFNGPMPNIRKLITLKAIYLSNNHFSGDIRDDAFEGMSSLKKLCLEHNDFTGRIPSSVAALDKLYELRLNGNQFEGQIPDLPQKGLDLVDLSNNKLEGPIPPSMKRMNTKSFSGNQQLCGPPLGECSPDQKPRASEPPPSSEDNQQSSSDKNSPSSKKVLLIVVIILAILLAIIAVFFILYYRKNRKTQIDRTALLVDNNQTKSPAASHHPAPVETRSLGNVKSTRKAEAGKLSFVRDDRERFDLQDLLRASAEVLGSGTFGSSYKAVLLNGQAMVVKRYRQMNNVGREEFNEYMRRLGRIRHQNLLPIVAYYYRKEEKLLIADFVENGSLASQLHGNHTEDQPPLNWPTRLKIVKGVVKGLAYLYSELPNLIVPHGHLKSSNVLIDENYEPLLTDYALVPMINLEQAQQLMVVYKSPEYAQHGRLMKKTDIWSLGVLILEVLTGRFPANYLTQSYTTESDLATWVNSVDREKWTTEVFDKEMGGKENGEGEMLKLLKIGLCCCEEDVERRWDMKEIVKKVEELKELDGDDEVFVDVV